MVVRMEEVVLASRVSLACVLEVGKNFLRGCFRGWEEVGWSLQIH